MRFPREWIGPLEDLVPIRSVSEDDDPDVDDEGPPGADAFWTENAGALHDAIQAPAPPPSVPSVSEERGRQAPAERDPHGRRVGLGIRAPRRRSGPVRPAAGSRLGDVARLTGIAAPPFPPARRLVAATLAVALVAMAVIGTVWSSGHGGTSGPRSVAQSGGVDARDQARAVATPASGAARVSHRQPARRRSANERRRASGRTPPATHHKPSAAPPSHASGFVSSSHVVSAEPVTTPTHGYSSPTAATQPSATASPSASTPRPSPTTSSTGPTASSASSAGTPAFGSGGALGPGSSPDG